MDDVSGLACLIETLMHRERLLLNTLLWLACAIALLSAVFCLEGCPGFGIDVVSGSSRSAGDVLAHNLFSILSATWSGTHPRITLETWKQKIIFN